MGFKLDDVTNALNISNNNPDIAVQLPSSHIDNMDNEMQQIVK